MASEGEVVQLSGSNKNGVICLFTFADSSEPVRFPGIDRASW